MNLFKFLRFHSFLNENTGSARYLPSALFGEKKEKLAAIDIDERQKLLYELFFPIDSITFYIGAYNLSMKEVNTLVDSVIFAKRSILTKTGSIPEILNLQTSDENKKSNKTDVLQYRKAIIERDSSNILSSLIAREQKEIMKRISEANQDLKLQNIDKDTEYREMIVRIYEYIVNDDNISKMLNLEKKEFYRKKTVVSEDLRQNLNYFLSLGGFVVRIPTIFEIVSKIDSKNKKVMVTSWIKVIMKSVEELAKKTNTRNLIQQKQILIDFLTSFVYRKTSENDELLETKDEIYRKYFYSYEKLLEENMKQENEIIEVIKLIDMVSSGKIKITYNSEIAESYINYLLSTDEKDKKKLLDQLNK